MSRAKNILEEIAGGIFSSPVRDHRFTKYLQCQSCGSIHTLSSGILAPNSIRDPQINFSEKRKSHRCPACGGELLEVHKSLASVLQNQGFYGKNPFPGGAFHGGSFY